MIIEHNKRKLAVGLQWDSAADMKSAKLQAKKTPKAWHVAIQGLANVHHGLYEENAGANTYAAALLVGMVEPNAIICQILGDGDSCWVCTISEGYPVAGRDRVEPVAIAQKMATESATLFHDYPYIGDAESLPGAKRDLPSVLNELEEKLSHKEISRKQLDSVKLRRQATSPWVFVYLLLLIAALGAGWYGLNHYQKLQRENRLKDARLKSTAADFVRTKAEQEKRDKQIADFRRQVTEKRNDLASSIGGVKPLWDEWQSIRRAMPIARSGYSPGQMDCDKSACAVQWQGKGKYTRPSDKLRLPGVQADNEPSMAAKSVFEVTARTGSTGELFQVEAGDLRFELMNAFMQQYPGLQVDALKPVVVTPPPDLGLKEETVGSEGTWRLMLQGPGSLVQAEHFIRQVARWPVALTTAKYSSLSEMRGAASIELVGRYGVATPAQQQR